ncbi:MAG: hypothetical protein H7A38_01345 [Chlamydiales bacterium]|nr:hypothetical protein [Chlamydiales bacterium]
MQELLNPLSLENTLWGIGSIAVLLIALNDRFKSKSAQATLKKPAKKAN